MTERSEDQLSIGAVSQQTGVSPSTLRFYESEGLFLHEVRRDSAGRRTYSTVDVDWVLVCQRLRSAGMPLPQIRRYVALVRAGRHTQHQRLEVLREYEQALAAQIAGMQATLRVIEAKVRFFADHADQAVGEDLWLDSPACWVDFTPQSYDGAHSR